MVQLIIILVIGTQMCLAQQRVGIGTLAPHASAVLEMSTADKGVLIPRMTSMQRIGIPNPTNGLLVFDTTTPGFWYFDGVQWVRPTGLQGPIGIVGVTGPTGPTGSQGPIGLPSIIQGIAGSVGAIGPDGSVGPTGPAGAQGIVGVIGIDGPTGSIGLQGITGPIGIAGVTGATGSQGIVGATGAIGPTGIIGTIGSDGVVGPTGPLGPPSSNTAIVLGANGILSVTDPSSTLGTTVSDWTTAGNSVTSVPTNFVGTTDGNDFVIGTAAVERLRARTNGDIWVDGVRPFLLRRFSCNGCDNPNRNTGVSSAIYTAILGGWYPTANSSNESTRARVYSSGGTWWFKGDTEGPSSEDWDVDILFVKNQIVTDERPASASGGGVGF